MILIIPIEEDLVRKLAAAIGATAAIALPVAVPAVANAATASPHQRHIARSAADGGIVYLPTDLDLQPFGSGTWADSSLQVTLPRAGTYDLDLNVRTLLVAMPPIDAYMMARLWNVTSGTAVPKSERFVEQLNVQQGTALIDHHETTPINERVTVNGPTTIRLQATRVNYVGATTAAGVYSDTNGYTSLRFERVTPYLCPVWAIVWWC